MGREQRLHPCDGKAMLSCYLTLIPQFEGEQFRSGDECPTGV